MSAVSNGQWSHLREVPANYLGNLATCYDWQEGSNNDIIELLEENQVGPALPHKATRPADEEVPVAIAAELRC